MPHLNARLTEDNLSPDRGSSSRLDNPQRIDHGARQTELTSLGIVMKILVTGSAGFIGAHVCAAAADQGFDVVGVDSFNSYYDPNLKQARCQELTPAIEHVEMNISDFSKLSEFVKTEKPDVVVHLAAQAGVRHSFKQPQDYAESNLVGQVSLLEAVKNCSTVKRLIYASSSSVYSGVSSLPFSEDVTLGTPKSLYAASKIADEVLTDTYSRLFDIDAIGLRFFTVYGPWGRPDMAYWLFSQAIKEERPITLFNHGNVKRDFTYIDDIVSAILKMIKEVAASSQVKPSHDIYNIGNHSPEPIGKVIDILENLLSKKAIVELGDLPPGDMVETYAAVDKLQCAYGFSPDTPIESGLANFVSWYDDWCLGKFSGR